MGWLEAFRKRKSVPSLDQLRDSLLSAADTDDEVAIGKICRNEKDRILTNFHLWQKVPEALQADPQAVARYAHGLIAVAEWFARNGSQKLVTMLQMNDPKNPIHRWQDRFAEADTLKIKGHFAEASSILEGIAEEMNKYRGSAVTKHLPMVHGSLGECFFRSGQIQRAYDATRAALDGCLRGGDIEGVIIYTDNLARICKERGNVDEARYWLIASTNAMIQTGQEERAAQVRRSHNLEPIGGLIEAKKPIQ